MKFKAEVNVTGMKPSKGDFEGTAYDSTKVYVLEEMSAGKGQCTIEYSLGKSDEFAKFEHLPFPFIGEAEMEIQATGKDKKIVMLGLRPKQMAKAA